MNTTDLALSATEEAVIRRLLEADLSSLGFDNREVRAALRQMQAKLSAANEDEGQALVTTTQAAQQLGVQSSNTIKNWVRSGYLHGVRRGGRLLIPSSEIARIRDADRVARVRRAERLLDGSAALGGDSIPEETLHELADQRPGSLPWQRAG